MEIIDNLSYIISWHDSALEKECKTGMKGKYVNNFIKKLEDDPEINNIKYELHWAYSN